MNKINFFLIFFFLAPASFAGLLRVESNTYIAERKGDNLKKEAPLYEEFQSTYQNLEKKLDVNFNFGYSYNFYKKVYDFDLNQLNAEMEIIKDRTTLSVGRSFESNHLVKSSIVDSLSVDNKFLEGKLRAGVLLGFIRNFEFDQSSSASPVVSIYSDFNNRDIYPLYTELRFVSVDYTNLKRSKNQMLKLGVKKELPSSLSSDAYSNIERNIHDSQSYRYEAGVDFYPSLDWTFGFQCQQYNRVLSEGLEKSIFNTFSMGKINEYTAKMGKYFEHRLYSGLTVQYDRYPLQLDQEVSGHKEEWNLSFQTPSSFKITNDLFIMKSFGGKALGDLTNITYPFTDNINLFFENEYVDYQKVTSEKSVAKASRLGLGTAYFHPWKSQLMAEVTSNNFYSEEWSMLVKLSLIDWSEL